MHKSQSAFPFIFYDDAMMQNVVESTRTKLKMPELSMGGIVHTTIRTHMLLTLDINNV